MLRGFASNFPIGIRIKLANEIFSLSGEKPPCDINSTPLDFLTANGQYKVSYYSDFYVFF